MPEQPRRITRTGVVTSAKMQKTIKVQVERRAQDPRYKKYRRRRTVHLAHDEDQVAKQGDRVEIVQSRPLSKRKRWRLLRVLPEPAGAAGAAPGASEAQLPAEAPGVSVPQAAESADEVPTGLEGE